MTMVTRFGENMENERQPDVLVTVLGGVAVVNVVTPNVLVEIRDYDVDGTEDGLFVDESGDACVRSFVDYYVPGEK